jgi:hypothetical protein
MKSKILYVTNEAVQCRDIVSGKIGCFLFEYTETGDKKAISPVFPCYRDLVAWDNENGHSRFSRYEDQQ